MSAVVDPRCILYARAVLLRSLPGMNASMLSENPVRQTTSRGETREEGEEEGRSPGKQAAQFI